MEKRPRGRPKDETKRRALIEAARGLFLSRGLEVTTEEIACEAQVAKATLYANFADKNELLEAVIRAESDRNITDEEFEAFRKLPTEAALRSYGVRYLTFMNQRDMMGWDRLIAVAASRRPELGQRFFAAGPGRGRRQLAALIDAAVEGGEFAACDTEAAAGDLAGLWFGFSNLEVKLKVRSGFNESEIEARVVRGVALFFKIYGRPHPSDDAS